MIPASLKRTLRILLGSVSALGTAAFPQASLQVGYTVVTADPGTTVPVGAALFSFTNTSGILVSQAGVAAAEPILSGRIFVDQAGTQTGIALVNPSTQNATVTFVLRDPAGKQIERKSQTLGPGKHLASYVAQLFSSLAQNFTGSLTFTSDQRLAAITLRESRNAQGEPLYTTLPVVDLAAASQTQSLVLPQIAAGDGYSTQLILLNPSSEKLAGMIQLTSSDGRPLALRLGGEIASQFTYQIEAHGTYRAEFDRPEGLATGYALVTPESGTTAPSGSAIFQVRQNSMLVTEAGVGATNTTTQARIFVDNIRSFTGVALANPSDQRTTVTFALFDRFATVLDTVTRTLPSRGHLAIFAHQLFSSLPDNFTGLLDISATAPVAAVTLKLTINGRNDQVLTTLPVADVTKPPADTTAIFPQIAIGEGFSTRLIFINPLASKSTDGQMRFFQSDGTAIIVPLGGKSGSEFSYSVAAGGGRQYLPGNSVAAASISVIDPSSNQAAREIVVNEGQSLRPGILVFDTMGLARDDFDLSFISLATDIATVDATGNLRGRKAGFSTLTIVAGSILAAATITVVSVNSGAAGFEIMGIAQDSARRLYFANSSDHTILLAEELKQAPALYAGIAKSEGLKNDLRLQSLFKNPSFLAFNQAEGSLYVTDKSNHSIRRIQPGSSGKVETLAGTGATGSIDGTAAGASFNNPQGIVLDAKGNLWIADTGNHTIRRVQLAPGIVQTIAGKAGVEGWVDATGDKARFSSPTGIALETETQAQELERQLKGLPPPPVSILVADTGNGVIRRVKETGEVETFRATTVSPSGEGGPRSAPAPVSFASPTGVYVDSLGNIYVSEPDARRVRVMLKNGETVPVSQPNTFTRPRGIVITRNGRVVISDSTNVAREVVYGEPQITSFTPTLISSKGGETVTVKGNNFAPETIVVVAGVLVSKVDITDTRTFSFTAPSLPSGRSTLTVQNRGGLAQKEITVDAIPLASLSRGQITTLAGGATFAGDGTTSPTARVVFPLGVAVDSAGNVFIADTENHRIRRITARTGIITTVAGTGQPDYSGDLGPATAAALRSPEAVAFDNSGNLIFADSGNYRIRKVDARAGVITTIAGGGDPADRLGDNGPATNAALSGVSGIASDAPGNLYIADTGNNRIRKVDAKTGIITTVAGNGSVGYSGDGDSAAKASLNLPERIAVDSAGNLFIADTRNYRVRKVDRVTGTINTIAGTGTLGFSGDNGSATAAQIDPAGIAVDADGNFYIADRANERVRKVNGATKIITTVAGNGETGPSGDNGPATSANLRFIHGIAVDAAGNLYIADSGNNRVRMVAARTQIITTLAGASPINYLGDNGLAIAGTLHSPRSIAADSKGNLFIADSDHNRVRKVEAANRKITTFAGTGEETFSGEGELATKASFVVPAGVAADSLANVHIAAAGNSRVLRVEATTGTLTTVAGTGQNGYSGDNGPAILAEINEPSAIAFDARDNLFIADTSNNRIRKVDSATKIITTVAGGGTTFADNILATTTSLNQPSGIAVDKDGNLYIADTHNHRIRKVTSGGTITTVAGNGTDGWRGDGGSATAAELSAPRGVALDSAGNIYVADSNNVIRRVEAATGIIKTIAGTGDAGSSGDGGLATAATLAFPYGIFLDAAGNLYIADTYNHRIRVIRGPIP